MEIFNLIRQNWFRNCVRNFRNVKRSVDISDRDRSEVRVREKVVYNLDTDIWDNAI